MLCLSTEKERSSSHIRCGRVNGGGESRSPAQWLRPRLSKPDQVSSANATFDLLEYQLDEKEDPAFRSEVVLWAHEVIFSSLI